MADLILCSGKRCKLSHSCLRALVEPVDQHDNFYETPPCSADGLTCGSFIQYYCPDCREKADSIHKCNKDKAVVIYDIKEEVDWKKLFMKVLYNLGESTKFGIGATEKEMKIIDEEYNIYVRRRTKRNE
jgi:hypothetical protein